MRWIDFRSKTPMAADLLGWTPWTSVRWNAWLAESTRLLGELAKLDVAGDIKGRNKMIDDNSNHWGELKPWLLALSYRKCWYTEGKDICSHFDVEHFRPKSESGNGDGTVRDAYWWMAFDYSNYRASGNVPNRKKGSLFPLHQNSLVSTYSIRCEASEDQFLLDPTDAHDPSLLAFNEEGNAIAAPGCDAWSQLRVDKSIEILKLNEHDALPAERRSVWQKASQLMDEFLKAKASYHPKNNPMPRVTMEEKARQIREMARSSSQLSMVVVWCARFRNDQSVLRLVDG